MGSHNEFYDKFQVREHIHLIMQHLRDNASYAHGMAGECCVCDYGSACITVVFEHEHST